MSSKNEKELFSLDSGIRKEITFCRLLLFHLNVCKKNKVAKKNNALA